MDSIYRHGEGDEKLTCDINSIIIQSFVYPSVPARRKLDEMKKTWVWSVNISGEDQLVCTWIAESEYVNNWLTIQWLGETGQFKEYYNMVKLLCYLHLLWIKYSKILFIS